MNHTILSIAVNLSLFEGIARRKARAVT